MVNIEKMDKKYSHQPTDGRDDNISRISDDIKSQIAKYSTYVQSNNSTCIVADVWNIVVDYYTENAHVVDTLMNFGDWFIPTPWDLGQICFFIKHYREDKTTRMCVTMYQCGRIKPDVTYPSKTYWELTDRNALETLLILPNENSQSECMCDDLFYFPKLRKLMYEICNATYPKKLNRGHSYNSF